MGDYSRQIYELVQERNRYCSMYYDAATERDRLRDELDRWQDRVSDRATVAEAERDRAVAQVQRLRVYVETIADRGLSADLTPTMMFGGSEGAMYIAMCEYLQRIDKTHRSAARAALAGEGSEQLPAKPGHDHTWDERDGFCGDAACHAHVNDHGGPDGA